MREMTFGDLRVPREIKQVTTALLDRHKAYAEPCRTRRTASCRRPLPAQLRYLGDSEQFDIVALADYMRRAASTLDSYRARACWTAISTWPRARQRCVAAQR